MAALRAKVGSSYRSLKYRGDKVICPVCGGRFSQFLRFNARPNAQCPRCLSLERHRTMWIYLMESGVLVDPQSRVLDIAPRAAMSRRLERKLRGRYVSGDLMLPPVSVYLDLTALPFLDASFNVVICSHVLEHVPDDRAAMAQLRRVLQPGGFAFVPVPIHPTNTETIEDPAITSDADRERVFGQRDHVRWYARDDFESRLRDAGLRPELIDVTTRSSAMNLDPEVYVGHID